MSKLTNGEGTVLFSAPSLVRCKCGFETNSRRGLSVHIRNWICEEEHGEQK